MRQIGQKITEEQNLMGPQIHFLIMISHAILYAFAKNQEYTMRELAGELKMAPMTLYRYLRLVVEAIILVHRTKKSIEGVISQMQEIKTRLSQTEKALEGAKSEIDKLTAKLFQFKGEIKGLEAEIIRLKEQWKMSIRRLILVLKMSGRCTVRSIVEILDEGLNVQYSVGYVQGVIQEAGTNAEGCFQKLLQVIPLSGAICIDEVFLKEAGQKIWGIVIVDPLSGLVLHFERTVERSSEAIITVIQNFKDARPGVELLIKLCLTDMYQGYLKPVKNLWSKAVHQFCWFHINCFHIGSTVKQSERAYQRALKALENFDKKNKGPLDKKEKEERKALVWAIAQAKKNWQGALRFRSMLRRVLTSKTLEIATKRLNSLIDAALKGKNPYVNKMGTLLLDHKQRLLSFYTCLESQPHLLKRLSNSQQSWVPATKRWAIQETTNAAEHVFRFFPSLPKNMEQFRYRIKRALGVSIAKLK